MYASVIVGNEIILGGAFTQATSPTGTVVGRQRIAAFNLSTGDLITSFQANASSEVRALVSDGSTVWVGGTFGSVNGSSRSRIAAIDASTGAVRSFNPGANGNVRALDLRAGRLFVGGGFTTLGGDSHNHVGAVNPQTGEADGDFRPSTNGPVYGVRSNPGGTTVYVAGDFSQVSGSNRSGVGAVDGTSGAATGPSFNSSVSPTFGLDMNPGGNLLYGAGGTGQNTAAAWNTGSGNRTWHVTTLGDIQAIRYAPDGNVYFGFHDGYQGNTNTKLLGVNANNGGVTGFRPVFNMFWGVFAIAASTEWVVAGGEFSRVTGVTAGNWARFRIT